MPYVKSSQKGVVEVAHTVNHEVGGKQVRRVDSATSAGNFFKMKILAYYPQLVTVVRNRPEHSGSSPGNRVDEVLAVKGSSPFLRPPNENIICTIQYKNITCNEMEEENFTLAEVEFLACTFLGQKAYQYENSGEMPLFGNWYRAFIKLWPNWRESVSSTDKKEKKDA